MSTKKFETKLFPHFILEFYRGEQIAPLKPFASAIYTDVIENMIKACCIQNKDEYLLRKYFLKDILSACFGTEITKFPYRMSGLCDKVGNAQPWFRAFDNR